MIRTNKLRGQELRQRLVELSQPPRYDSRMKVQNAIHKSLEDMGDDDEDIDLEEILREMGHYEEEDDDIEEQIRSYVRDIVRNEFYDLVKWKNIPRKKRSYWEW